MKIILSRKGFDASNGGCASPIMPDGTLLSMPIPSNDKDRYSDLCWNDITYSELLSELRPNKTYAGCHVDPDIRKNRVSAIDDWLPAFGQIGAAQGLLANAGVEAGDIFLFFGWFRHVEKTEKGYRYVRRKGDDFYAYADMNIIYGYMQVGEILTAPEKISKYHWHPHASEERLEKTNNALYLPAKTLSFAPSLKGCGTLDFRKDRVLTMEGKGRATWNEYAFLMPEHIYGKKKNSAKNGGLYYSGIWQELVVYESDGLLEWVKNILI